MLTTEGPLLVLAGAGTGKTRVITYRAAYLIEKGVPGRAILAVTFTNKAAAVMKERIGDLLRSSGLDTSDVWVSTFHSFCARLLRREALHAGLPSDFAIYDDDDQTAAIKRTLMQLDLPADDYPPRSMRAQISHAFGPPGIEQRAHATKVFEPERDGGEFEHLGIVPQGGFLSAGACFGRRGVPQGDFLRGVGDGRGDHWWSEGALPP